MLRVLDFRSGLPQASDLLNEVPRAALDIQKAVALVEPLIDDVRERGEAALRAQAEQFDGVTGHTIRVSDAEIAEAVAAMDPALRRSVEKMASRVRQATAAGVPEDSSTTIAPGAVVRQRWAPVDRVGLYVPGGKAVYPSSVVMNVIPAQVAGVRELAIATPVQRDSGTADPTVLGVAGILGVTEIYAMGGAGAIAALAYGVSEVDLAPVDVITGPGNIFVAAAKRCVNGRVGIDAEAGTTEILILADSSAHPHMVAADLISQAEHDEAAAAVLVTDCEDLANAVQNEVRHRVEKTPNSERAKVALTGPQSAIILVQNLNDAIDVANAYAAEHLEVQVAEPEAALGKIRHAGAIFMGSYSPVSLGDYMAGSNHVLPTGGTARFQPGLGAHSFLRPQQIIEYSRDALADISDGLVAIARQERLPAHGEAVTARFEDEA